MTADAYRNRGFHAWGWTVHVIATDGCRKRGRIDEAAARGAMPAIDVTLCRHWFFARYGFSPWFPLKMLTAMRQADFVFVGGIATWPATAAALLCAALRKPYAVALHGGLLGEHVDEIRRTKRHKWLYYRVFTLPTLRRAAFVNVASAFEEREVRQLLPDAKIVVTANALDLSMFEPTEVPSAANGVRMIYVGRISPEKGVRALVKAWIDVAGPDDSLEIVGSGKGRYAEEVIELAAADVRILHAGELPHAEVLTRIAQSHGLILASGLDGPLKENFGNVAAEALALGRPVLVPAGLAWDAIDAEGAGVIFAPTTAGLKIALRRFSELTDDERRAAGRRARAFAEQRLDVAGATAELVKVITGLDCVAPRPVP